jgi:hypothetical protein
MGQFAQDKRCRLRRAAALGDEIETEVLRIPI